MKTGKKVSITILSVLILALCAVGIIRSTTFPLDPATLPDHICDFYNIGRPKPLSLWGDRIFEKCGIRRDEGGDGGKTLEIRGKRRLPARDGGANYQQS